VLFFRFVPLFRYGLFPVLLLQVLTTSGQTDSLTMLPAILEDLVEDFMQQQGDESDFSFNALFESLEHFRTHPLDLNRAGATQLQELRLLDERQIAALLEYRREVGPLIAVYELQAVPGFDLPTIRRILPFVTLDGDLQDFQVPLRTLITRGKNEVFVRWQRILEPQEGYQGATTGASRPAYQGDPNYFYLRYRHTYSNRLSFGFTAEKDRGEEFFSGSNRQGFDFYSAHLYLRDYNRRLRALAIGDFKVSFGQGLLLFSGFGAGKGSASISVKRSGRPLRHYASVNEAAFMRGAGATITLGRHWEVTAFLSRRLRDGNLTAVDTATGTAEIVTSLGESGLHRTANEIADERVLRQFTTGGSLRYQRQRGHLAVNVLHETLDRELRRQPQLYNRFYFQGRRLLNASIDYTYIYHNLHLFGETAVDRGGRLAALHGLLLGLDRRADLALLFRHYPRGYAALNANPFGEGSGGRNETGLYLGLELRPARYWTLNAYYDAWRHPWLRFNADAPSRGREFRGRITYYRKRRLRAYLELRDQTVERNAPGVLRPHDVLIPHRRFQIRLHVAYHPSRSLELRNRLDWGFAANAAEGRRQGFVLLQDILFRPIESRLSFTARFALFDTDAYDIRFYHYENNLLYAFSIPAYYQRGTRFYLNLRYRPTPALTLELRFAQTYHAGQNAIGSGPEAIAGPLRSEISAQVKYQFSKYF